MGMADIHCAGGCVCGTRALALYDKYGGENGTSAMAPAAAAQYAAAGGWGFGWCGGRWRGGVQGRGGSGYAGVLTGRHANAPGHQSASPQVRYHDRDAMPPSAPHCRIPIPVPIPMPSTVAAAAAEAQTGLAMAPAARLDGLWEPRASQLQLGCVQALLMTAPAGQAPGAGTGAAAPPDMGSCRVLVRVAQDTRSGAHKVSGQCDCRVKERRLCLAVALFYYDCFIWITLAQCSHNRRRLQISLC